MMEAETVSKTLSLTACLHGLLPKKTSLHSFTVKASTLKYKYTKIKVCHYTRIDKQLCNSVTVCCCSCQWD